MAFSLTKMSGSVIDPLVFEISKCEGEKSTIEKTKVIYIRFENNFKVYSSFVTYKRGNPIREMFRAALPRTSVLHN